MIKNIIYLLTPLLVLLAASSLACIVGYFIVQGMDGQLVLSKIISKATQLFLVVSIFPAMAYLKLTKTDLGFAIKAVFLKQIFIGLGLGLISLMPIFIILYVLGIDIVDQSQSWTAGLIAKKTTLSLLLALLIAVFEELIFRGVLLAGLKKNMPVIAAVFISSVYFAALHFLNSKIEIPQHELTLLSGFNLLADAFANVLNPKNASAFLSLLAVGIFLAVLRTQIKESLGLCIGCHAGWVWQIKMNGTIFNTDFNSHYLNLVSSYNYVVGPLVTGWLGLAIIGYFAFKKVKS
jgi:membrane protease YdiL (CAAX protease family)